MKQSKRMKVKCKTCGKEVELYKTISGNCFKCREKEFSNLENSK